MLRNVSNANYRTKRLMDLMNKTTPDLSNEVDLDAIDMQDYKFNTNDVVTILQRKRDDGELWSVTVVTDEIICLNPVQEVNK